MRNSRKRAGKKSTQGKKSVTPLRGYDGSTIMNEEQTNKRRAKDTEAAQKGFMREMDALHRQEHRPKLAKLQERVKPLATPAPDPHKDLVKAPGMNPNEPSVQSEEPNLVQIQQHLGVVKGRR